MDLKDIGARFKQKREEQAPPPRARDFTEIHALRGRILGVLIRDARLAHGNTAAEVAAQLGVAEALVEAWEFGTASPSLPQLEMLAFFLDVPVSRFWSQKTLGEQTHERDLPVPVEDYGALRDRVIGVRLTVARKEAKLSVEELASACGLAPQHIAAYEVGQAAIPFPVLTSLANAVRRNIGYFLEETGRIGGWLRLQEEYNRFCELPDEMRMFVTQPVNQAFIEIAMRLSALPLKELRTVGEKILDITL